MLQQPTVGLVLLLLVFDWRLGLLCLIPVVIAFVVMSCMMGDNMKENGRVPECIGGNVERGG
ncbi:MAG: hypothetical protein ACLRMX_07935 [Lachnospira eligens]